MAELAEAAGALDALAAAAGAWAQVVQGMAPHMEALGDHVLQEGSRLRRAGFLRCLGCEDCSEPLPLLAGDV